MPQDGDVIAFDYDLYVEGRDPVFDTTLKETAEKAGLLDPNAFYAPMSYLVGSGRLIKGLEEGLRGCEVGVPKTLELGVDEAYGPRDLKLIETLPMQEFKRNKIEPEVGLVITYKQRRGTVTYVGGGRIRVDFNHALAGKRLRYVVTLRSVAKTPEEKVRGVIQMVFPTALHWKVSVEGDTATIEVPETLRFAENFPVAKFRVVNELRRIAGLRHARFVETFDVRREEKETAAAPVSAPPG